MIDWILAERLAALVAGRGERSGLVHLPNGVASGPNAVARGPNAMPSAARLEAIAADAAVRVARYTGLTPARPLPAPEAISRSEWVRANVASMRRLLEPVLERAGERLTPSRALRPAVSLTVSLVVTTEVGVVLGYLAQRVLGQYELVLLDEPVETHPPRLLFVLPNLVGAVASLDAPEDEFLTWVTLHEVTHAVQFSGVPWLQRYLAGLVTELMQSAELRIDSPRRRPSRAQLTRSLKAMREGDIVGIFASPGERATLDRVQAVMAVIEGHAEHVMDAVAPDLLPSLPRLRSALNRRRRTQSRLSRVLGTLLGLELKLRQYEQGKFFCDAIVEAAGTEALVRVFASPQSLPSLPELTDPPAWVRRMGLGASLPETTGA